MEEDYGAVQESHEHGDYDADYANYYQQQEGDYYSSYQQDGYEGYYYQQGEQEGTDQYSYDPNYTDPEGQEYSYDPNYAGPEGQDYSYYTADVVEQEAYATEGGEQAYLDQLAVEQATGYYYDNQGNLIEYAGAESPTSVFNQETYWEQDNMIQDTQVTTPGEDETEERNLTESVPMGTDSASTPEENSSRRTKKEGKNGRASSPSRKKKTKKERVAQRQALLEKEEEERLKKEENAEAANDASGAASTAKTAKVSKKKVGFVERGKAKLQMKLRIAKAIKRDRMPVQIRILPTVY